MTYPTQPDFTSISDTDAWWIISTPDGSAIAAICSMGGRAFVDLTQMILGLPSNGVWDASVSSALVATLRGAGASGSLVNAISGEAASRRVGTNSVKGAIFLMHRGQSFGGGVPLSVDEGRIGVGPNTVTPQWGVAAPPGPNGDLPPVCVPAGTPVQVPAPPGQPIPSVDVTVPPYTPPPTTGPGKPVITPAAGGSSGLILGLVAVAAVGGVAWVAMKKPKANPTREMTERDRMREREKAKKFFKRLVETHGPSIVGELGDQLVLGDFDWREWFNEKPSNVFMNELDQQRIYWEMEHERGY